MAICVVMSMAVNFIIKKDAQYYNNSFRLSPMTVRIQKIIFFYISLSDHICPTKGPEHLVHGSLYKIKITIC